MIQVCEYSRVFYEKIIDKYIFKDGHICRARQRQPRSS